jgi:hypothetical protein
MIERRHLIIDKLFLIDTYLHTYRHIYLSLPRRRRRHHRLS